MLDAYPGTPHHQALLEQVVSHYRDDSRVLAICLFGSLVRGNWDRYSDLDLDIVIADGIQINVIEELHNLRAAFQPLGEHALIIVPGDDNGDIVLNSLAELSIRYHALKTTSPAIVDNVLVLGGQLDSETIKAAGNANRRPTHTVSDHDTDRILRWALEVTIQLHREQFWQAARLLEYIRETLLETFAFSRGYSRVYHAFDADTDEAFKAHIGATFPLHSMESIREVLSEVLIILETDLDALSNGLLHLSHSQREIISKIRSNYPPSISENPTLG